MGVKTIPEQNLYFCDICKNNLSEKSHDDRILTLSKAWRDGAGYDMNTINTKYEVCTSCEARIDVFIKGMKK